MNPGPKQFEPAHNAARCEGHASADQVTQTIVETIGIAGVGLAAIVGYLIEVAATNGASGFAGALVCPLIFSALYRSFPPPDA